MSAQKAFTLVELLVVISIIAILSAVGFVSYQGIRGKAIEAKVKADIDSIKKAYESNFDPTLLGGQGGYKPLLDSNFASGKIPTDKNGGSYILAGSYATTTNPNPTIVTTNFGACGDTSTGQSCTLPGGSCNCVQSTQGSGSFDFLTLPTNLIPNPSFETDTTGWIIWNPGNLPNARDITIARSGIASFKVVMDTQVANVIDWTTVVSGVVNSTYIFSGYVKRSDNGLINSGSIQARVVDSVGNRVAPFTTYEAVDNGWYRVSMSLISPTSVGIRFIGGTISAFYADAFRLGQ